MEQKISEGQSRKHATADIIKKGSIITIITLISRPIGYVREAIQAYLFGATFLVDAFIVAFNFPELIQTLFLSAATSAFLVPICTKYLHDDEEYSKIYSTFINISIVITLFISVLFLIFSGALTHVIAPGFSPEAKGVTKNLFMIMIPVIAFHAILSVMKAFLNAKEHFAAPELSGILWNVVFISSALLLNKQLGIYSLALGVSAGAFLQIIMQIPYLRNNGIHYRTTIDLHHPSVVQAKQLFFGALVATSIVPINSFIGRVIASYLPHGEVASLAYAFRIFILPFSLFAVPVYTVMFSKISRLYHEKDWKGMAAHLDSSIVLLAITLIPSTIVLCSLGDICIKILYQRGAFTAYDTAMTNRALFGYAIGLIFYALSMSFVRIFNAMHDMKTPAIIGLTSIALNAALAALLMVPLGNLGVSLATSIVSCYNFIMLYIILKKRVNYRINKRTMHDIIKSLLAGVILVLLIYFTKKLCQNNLYLTLLISLFFTVAVYGLFFRQYYIMLLKKR